MVVTGFGVLFKWSGPRCIYCSNKKWSFWNQKKILELKDCQPSSLSGKAGDLAVSSNTSLN
jgi:hypothetical protein